MTATLVAKDLAAGHGDRALFSGLDLVVAPGDVIGLVGPNGAGKSTLLRMLAGHVAPEEGSVRLSPPSASVGHLPQEPERRPGRRSRASWRAVRASRRRRGTWTRRRRGWSRGARAPTTRTRRRWSAGSPSAARTWTTGPARSRPSSASMSTSGSR
ncbi:ATP-binding cassette domain-containing protein [Actinomadura yumaensis]|uniref:ATP-binding cassette domain-containing protein n=1 Tax=Actinomadura yumaensis TaxID=111807 RepID=UPI00360B40CA